LLQPFASDLTAHPLAISLDKDVMTDAEAVVNWDSGFLEFTEVQSVLQAFLQAAQGRVLGCDVVGDWSGVHVSGLLRRGLHALEHPALTVDPIEAARRNERTNLALLHFLDGVFGPASGS
jgi:hypothetical protein